ncbi:MAG TPA: hypothetical protein VJ777_22935 [Mycobacterium sp.]|nr:hypothetical protein [Mycobacterium sp.]
MKQITAAELLDLQPGTRIACHPVAGLWAASFDAVQQYPTRIVWATVTDTKDDGTHVIINVGGRMLRVVKTAQLAARIPESQVPFDALTVRILRDVHDGLVSLLPHDYISIPDDVLPPDAENYRLRVLSLDVYAFIMPIEGTGKMRLSSTGEHYWRYTNVERYQSKTAIAAVDVDGGQVVQHV